MKTTLKNLAITESLATYFKESYSVKMGGTQIVEFPCGSQFFFDDKEYYSGRGAKYNSSINHQNLGVILVTKKQLIDYVNRLNEVAKIKKENDKIAKLENLKIKEATKNGVYYISENGTVKRTPIEYENDTFDAEKLARTLKISIEDANLLNSEGKTYVFSKSEDGNVYELYHSDLGCNHLSIWVGIATPERIAEFSPKEWKNAKYSILVGQTSNNNHFVC